MAGVLNQFCSHAGNHTGSNSPVNFEQPDDSTAVENVDGTNSNDDCRPARHPKPANRELVSAALRWLARRDMSRSEFIAKLTKLGTRPVSPLSSPQSFALSSVKSAFKTARFGKSVAPKQTEFSAEEIEAVAVWCTAEGFLNEIRFAEGKARSLANRYGASRVGATLKQKGVAEETVAATIIALKATDLARARAMWLRKFGEPTTDSNKRNKQIRYLLFRGFGFDVIKHVIDGSTDEDGQ